MYYGLKQPNWLISRIIISDSYELSIAINNQNFLDHSLGQRSTTTLVCV